MSADLLQLTGEVSIQAAADGQAKTPRVSILAYTGGTMNISGFGPVAVDLVGANIGGDIPLLADHQGTLDNIAGQGQATIRNQQLYVEGVLTDATTAGQKVLALARSGITLQASIGFAPERREQVAPGQTFTINGRSVTAGASGLTIIRSGRLREVSLLPIGADPNTQVSIAASAASSKGTKNMADDNDFVVTAAETARLQANFHSAMIDPVLEQKRQQLIECWAPKLGASAPAELQAKAADLKASAVAGEISLDQLRLGALELIRAERPRGPAIHGSTRDMDSTIIEASLCRTLGVRDMEKKFAPAVLESADRAGNVGVQELIVRAAMANGYSGGRLRIDGGNIREVLKAAFDPAITASGFSTLNVSSILSNTANKVLLDGFNAVEQTWRLISKIRPVSDFKDSVSHRLTDSLEYEEVGPAGEVKHGTLGEETYTNRARTFAKMLGLTRQDIINDDLGAFDTIRQRLGRGAGLALNKVFWSAFLDDAAFFTVARGNLIADVLTDDPDSLNDSVAAFAGLTDGDGNPLGIQPAILLVPPILSPTAKRLYTSTEIRNTTDATQFAVANVYQGMYKPAVSAYLASAAVAGHSSTAWWLLADPTVLPAMEVCFLDGRESPTIESADADFNTLGIQFRAFHDFGCVKAEYRAGVKSTGAG
jgi:hypothetical protein